MQENKKCEAHSKEIIEIRTEFNQYRTSTNALLDEIIDRLKEAVKPQFSTPQLTLVLLSALGYMAGIMLYVSDIKTDVRVNDTRIESSETRDQIINIKLDKLLQDVAVLNANK